VVVEGAGVVRFGGASSTDPASWTVFGLAETGVGPYTPFRLAFDASGTLWVGTTSEGLLRYDGAEWTRYTPETSPLPHETVGVLAVAPGGALWVGTPGGLAVIPPVGGTASEPEARGPSEPGGLTVYPNPAVGALTAAFVLDRPGRVEVSLYDLLGRRARVAVAAVLPAGPHVVGVDVAGLPAGRYVLRVADPGGVQARAVTVLSR
jgi:hypothetical protein